MEQQGHMTPERAAYLLDFPVSHDLVLHEAGVPPIHTRVETLESLSASQREGFFLVHTTVEALPADTTLQLAPQGLENTLRLEVPPLENAVALQYLRALRAVDHFESLPLAGVSAFLEMATTRCVPAGEPIVQTGEPGDAFYIILEGRCAVYRGEVPMKIFGMFEYFGEVALLLDGPRTADVVALTDTRLLVLDRPDFLQLVEGTAVAAKLRRLYARRDEGTWRLLDMNPLLQHLGAAQRTHLQALLERITFERGQVLSQRGKGPEVLLLLDFGSVEWMGSRWGEGSLVGEAARVVDQREQGFTVRAVTNGVAYRADPEGARDFLLRYPGLFLRLVQGR
jgi:hypothetical protein